MSKSYEIRMGLAMQPLRQPVIRRMIKVLQLPPGSRGLDAGCGLGQQAMLLAQELGPAGRVTGLDTSAELLDYSRGLVEQAGLSDRIALKQGDIAAIPFEDGAFDWVWSCDCVGYAPVDPMPFLREMMRVVRPGGVIAIAAWSSQVMLPGYPRLEARLGATSAGIAPFTYDKDPAGHFLRALGWFNRLGLAQLQAETFAGGCHAPLSQEIRTALAALLEMRWQGAEEELSAEDRAEFARLCTPTSPDFILDSPDYYMLFTYSLFWAVRPAE